MTIGDAPADETLTIDNDGGEEAAFRLVELDLGYEPFVQLNPGEKSNRDRGPIELSVSGPSSSKTTGQLNTAFPNADVDLILDDGTVENNIGIGGTWEFLFLNRFTPPASAYPFTLNEIQVYFSSDSLVNVGDEMVLVVYENTSGNSDPAVGANFLGRFPVTVQAVGAWNTFTLPSGVPLAGPGDVLIGVIATEIPGSTYYPAAMDQTASQQRSWAGWWLNSPPPAVPTLPPDDEWILIDTYFSGNWLIRGLGTSGVADVVWLSEDPVTGAIDNGYSVDVTVTFDPSTLGQPGDYLAELMVQHETPYTYANIPVWLHLQAPETWGTFSGIVSGLEACDVNPAALEGATVNIYDAESSLVGTTTTGASGNYAWSLEAGTYDIEVVAGGFISQTRYDYPVAGSETITVNFDLRLDAPCVSVEPASLEQYLYPNSTAAQTLTLINTGAGEATFELLEGNGSYQPPADAYTGKVPSYRYTPEKDLPGADNSKQAPSVLSRPNHLPGNMPMEILINEGFEGAVFPPTDWTRVVNNSSYTWAQSTTPYTHSGSYGAYVPWNYDQDEWLLTPELALAEGTLSVWSEGSIVWCRDTYDNCDLNVWLVVDEVGGGDDVFVANLDEDWPANWTWTQATIDLAAFLPGVPVKIGFQYIGDDDADVAIDDIALDGVVGLDIPWLSENPVTGTIPAGGTLDVAVTFNSTGLALGDYLATLQVRNSPYPVIHVPVTLHVVDNLPPVAGNQAITGPEDTPLIATLTATDPEDDALTWTILDPPDHGALSGTAPHLIYTPDENYTGADSFTFKVNDGEYDSNVATVGILITPVNDSPLAAGQEVSTSEDTGVGVTLGASDVEGDDLTWTIVDSPENGTLSGTAPNLTYTPEDNFNGADSFTFKVNDGEFDSNVASVAITVTPLNDAPLAAGDAYSANENAVLTVGTATGVLANDDDVDGDDLTAVLVDPVTNGTLALAADGSFVYTPDTNYAGTDSFTYQAFDGEAYSAVVTVTITVTEVSEGYKVLLPIVFRH